MRETSNALRATIEESLPRLRAIGEDQASVRPAAGGWSKKEILGHLIDSTANNHHRFVRAQQSNPLIFPRYDPDFWVSAQSYQTAPWAALVELWGYYNVHLAHVMEGIPLEMSANATNIAADEPGTLGELVKDYLVHLRHHLSELIPGPFSQESL